MLAAALALGVGVRLLNLQDQVLVGDERWDLLAAMDLSMPEILTGFVYGRSSYSPPLAALYRLLVEVGVRPSEIELRVPALVCGCLAIVMLPLLAQRWIGRSPALCLAFTIALSPGLVWYSRLVRVYMPLVLVSCAAVLVFLRWYETRSRVAAAWYVLLAVLSAYLHPLSLPFVMAPFVFAVLDLARKREGRLGALRGLAVLGVAVAAGLAVVAAFSADSLAWLLGRSGADREVPGLDALGFAALRFSGSYSLALAIVFYAAAVRGLRALFRQQPAFATFGLVLVAIHLLSVLVVVVPPGLGEPVLLTRYVVVTLPLLLIWVAVGLMHPFPLPAILRPWAQPGLVALLLAAWFWTGPLATPEYRESSFTHVVIHRPWGARPPPTPLLESAGFYAALAVNERDGPVVEASWQDVAFQATAPSYQRLHGHRVIVASPLDDWWVDSRLELRNAVGLQPAQLLASDGRYVVVHMQPVQEEWEARGRDRSYREILAVAQQFAKNYELAQRKLALQLEQSFGPPDYSDAWVRAWDLERVRRSE